MSRSFNDLFRNLSRFGSLLQFSFNKDNYDTKQCRAIFEEYDGKKKALKNMTGAIEYIPGTRLLVAPTPKHLSKTIPQRIFRQHSPLIDHVIVFDTPQGIAKQCYVEYPCHVPAQDGKAKLRAAKIFQKPLITRWPDNISDSINLGFNSRILYILNLKQTSTTASLRNIYRETTFINVNRNVGKVGFRTQQACVQALYEEAWKLVTTENGHAMLQPLTLLN